MLCRVAESLFWMSRYIERAENTVRLVDVTLQSLLESDHETDDISFRHWIPILSSLGDLPLFKKLYTQQNSETVTDFLIFSSNNLSSVYSTIAAARENARMIRDQISSEMWEVINCLYLYLKKSDLASIHNDGYDELFQTVKDMSQLFQGVTDSTFPRRQGYDFIVMGKSLERADKTGRILDSKHYMKSETSAGQDAIAIAQWTALLTGCSALEAYNQIYVTDVTPENTTEFLLLSREFPRSIFFALNKFQSAMHTVSGCPLTHYSNEAERLCGALISRLSYTRISEILEKGLHNFLSETQAAINAIAIELNKKYMLTDIVDPTEELQTQRQS